MDMDASGELDFAKLERLEVWGTEIELFRAGSGLPLLFLHGLDGLEGSVSILQELAKSYEVFAPSHPGFGASELPDGMNRVDDMSYFYLDMLTVLDLDAPAIFGTSFGAWVACEMLTKEPHSARSLTLASPLGLKTADRREQWVVDLFMITKQELAQRLQFAPPEGPALTEMSETQMRRTLRADESLSLYGWSPYMCNPKLARRLHRIACPTMVIWGEEDAFVDPAYRLQWDQAMPRAEVRVLAAAGHRSHSDKPVELAAMIEAFSTGAAS